jgi:hypothetical protein
MVMSSRNGTSPVGAVIRTGDGGNVRLWYAYERSTEAETVAREHTHEGLIQWERDISAGEMELLGLHPGGIRELVDQRPHG